MTALSTTPFCVFITLGVILMVTTDLCFDVFSAIQRDSFMTHHTYRKVSAYSLYTCAAECLLSSVCLSFSFNKQRHICHLNDNNTAVTDIVPSQDFIYSDISPWPQSVSGPCAVTSCSGNTRCQVDRLHRATCVSEFLGCGQPPEVTGAKKKYEGHFLSAMATYSCYPDYYECHNKVTSVCQSSGQWENVTGLCRQFRWYNPAPRTDHYIPCGPSDTINITIVGEVTQSGRVTVDVARGRDLPYHVDFRLKFNEVTNTVAVNSRFNGNFGTEIRLETMPLTVGQQFNMEVSLQNGVYKMMVDGAVVHTLNERYPGLKPELVRIYNDVSVLEVEYTL